MAQLWAHMLLILATPGVSVETGFHGFMNPSTPESHDAWALTLSEMQTPYALYLELAFLFPLNSSFFKLFSIIIP